jgi:hypothetical protein
MSETQPRLRLAVEKEGHERREFRRHDLEQQQLNVDRWEGNRPGRPIGRIVDLSAGGVRVRMPKGNIKADQQIRVRLELPAYAGIHPFIDRTGPQLAARNEWVGWMTVARVLEAGEEEVDVAGRLVDMDEMDRGMLRLYLSTQPMAA